MHLRKGVECWEYFSFQFLSILTLVSNQFLSIYHIHSLDHIFTYTSFGLLYKFYGAVAGDRKNFVINIQTKERNTNLDILKKEKDQK